MEQSTPTAEEMHRTEALHALLEGHRYLEILERYIERGRFAPRLFESCLEALEELEQHALQLRISEDSLSRADLWNT